MKRCPDCNRVETDDTLAFCRADGTPLVRESGAVGEDAGTLKLGTTPVAGDTETRIMPQVETAPTNEQNLGGLTAPTTVLDGRRAPGSTQELSKPHGRRRAVIAVAALVFTFAAALTYLYVLRGKGTASKNSIAVLPFQNASGDSDVEYLSDGITESLINSLSQLPNVRVLARGTMFSFKGKELNPQEVGKQLGVEAVLTGRVVQRGDSLTVQTDLVDVADGSQVWGERYIRKASDVLTVQEEIAREIVGKLRLRLSGERQEQVTRRGTENAEAYKLYLRGRYFWNRRTVEDFKRAMPFFQRAVELDPGFALAYAGLSDSYNLLAQYNGASYADTMPQAKAAALKALALDENLAEAHGSLGQYLVEYEHDWAGGEREYERAVELNPNYASAHLWHAELLNYLGRFEEARAQAQRAVELDPLSPIANSMPARISLFARRHDEAIATFRKNIDLNPDWYGDYEYLFHAYAARGMYSEAADAYAKYMTNARAAPPEEIRTTRESFAGSGWQGFLRHRVRYLEGESKREYINPRILAELYAYLGERDKAFAYLEEAYRTRVSLPELKHNPCYDKLRPDPRYAELIRRVGLPQ